ncbi:MAG: hypothetical protein VCD00_10065 [Candidatus Hydrogenedentota bacterium]
MDETSQKSKSEEYDGERDMDRFWTVATRLKKEPVKQRWFLPLLLIVIVISIPWYRSSGEIGNIVGGLPTWVWTGLICALGVSIITAVGTLAFWKDDDDE